MSHPALGSRRAPERVFGALDLAVRRRLEGLLQGERPGLRLGPGSEAEEVVRYRPGEDDVRRIDWNVSARAQQTHVWRPRAEHELETWVLLDSSPSMDFGTTEVDKLDLASWAAGAVALLGDGPGNRVGFAHLGAQLTWSTPLPGRAAAYRMLHHTQRVAREVTSGAATDLATAISLLDRTRRRAGLRVVVSDFLEPDGRVERPFGWEPALRRLGHRHEVIAVEVVDPRELALPDVGMLTLVDPESGRQREVWTGSRALRERYAAATAAHRAAVAEAMRASGVAHVQLRTDRDWIVDLARFVRTANRRPSARTPVAGVSR